MLSDDVPDAQSSLANASSVQGGETFVFGQFSLIPSRRSLLDGDEPVRIGSRALDLLSLLVERAGEVVTKDELIRHAWPRTVVDEAGLRVHIAALRKALGESHSGIRYIANVPMRGYCFVVPVQRIAPQAPGAVAGLAAISTTIPPRLSRLIGRDETVNATEQTVLQRRFVTVVGPGGMGKTSVALAAVDRLAPHFEHGVIFVDLAGMLDANAVPGAVAAAMGIQLPANDAVAGIINWLGTRQVLVVLDNCEHVVDAAAVLAERLIGGTHKVYVLATSREPLRARGEWVQRLNSLDWPPLGTPVSYEKALTYPAFELFVERAMASLDGLSFSDADVPDIAYLCRSLDGMPLALELVAARVGMFGLRGLVERLDGHLLLPTLGHRTAMPRHQGLRATLDWSHGLLTPSEQRLLRRLSVFRERFTLEAAAGVTSVTDMERMEVTPLLMNLVAKSLVVAEPGGDSVSYRLLQTTNSYATERLSASGELADIRRRHAVYCLTQLDTVARDSEVLQPARWRERHGRRIDDLRAALDWAFDDGGDIELGVALLARSPTLWFGLAMAHEYMRRLEKVPQPLPQACSGGALEMHLHLVKGQVIIAVVGPAGEGEESLRTANALAQTLGDEQTQVRSLWSMFSLYALRGDYVQARNASQRLGDVARAAGDRGAEFVHHRIMALCQHFLGEQADALRHVRLALEPEAIALQPAQGTLFHLDHRAAGLTQLARILWLQGQSGAAIQAANDAMEAARDVDHALSLTYAMTYAACPIALWCGHDDEAERLVNALQACVEESQLLFWYSWPPLFRAVLASRRSEEVVVDVSRLHSSHIDTLPTLQPGLVDQAALERVRGGSNVWAAPEILRVHAESLLESDPDQAKNLLEEALSLSQKQGAYAWVLRCSTSLAKLAFQDGQDVRKARRRLQEAIELVDSETTTADLATALELIAKLEPNQRGAAGLRASQSSANLR